MGALHGASRVDRAHSDDGRAIETRWSAVVHFFRLGNSHSVDCDCRCCLATREPSMADDDLDARTGLVRHYPVSELEDAAEDAVLRAVTLETYWFGRDVIAAGYELHSGERFEDVAVTSPEGDQFAVEGWLAADAFELQFATGLRAVADEDALLAQRCVTLLERIPAGTGNAFCVI